jgi:hypothetical protein
LHDAHNFDGEITGVFDQTLIVGNLWHVHDVLGLSNRSFI